MFRRRLTRVPVVLVALLFSVMGITKVQANALIPNDPTTHFGGESIDNMWNVNVGICTNGVVVAGDQTYPLSSQTTQPYSLQLTGVGTTPSGTPSESNLPTPIPLQVSLPARIAGASAPLVPVSGVTVAAFATPVAAGTSVTVTVERWDHGQSSWVEDPDDGDTDNDATSTTNVTDTDGVPGTDESGFDDVQFLTAPAANCSVLPTTAAVVLWNKVALVPLDRFFGIGELRTFYSIDDASCSPANIASEPADCIEYTGPFTMPSGTHTVYFFSLDPNGNTEAQRTKTVTVSTQILRATVARDGRSVTFHWSLAHSPAISGFNLYAGASKLNQRVVPVQLTDRYTYTARTSARGPFALHVLLASGKEAVVPVK